jgi:hypothetical protein
MRMKYVEWMISCPVVYEILPNQWMIYCQRKVKQIEAARGLAWPGPLSWSAFSIFAGEGGFYLCVLYYHSPCTL